MEKLVVILIVTAAAAFLGFWLWRVLSGRSRCSCDSTPSCDACGKFPSSSEQDG